MIKIKINFLKYQKRSGSYDLSDTIKWNRVLPYD